MTLPRLFKNDYSSFPSLIDKFFEGSLMDWDTCNFAGSNSTLPAVNVKENNNEFIIDVAAPGLAKNDFKVNYNNGRLVISSGKKDAINSGLSVSDGQFLVMSGWCSIIGGTKTQP